MDNRISNWRNAAVGLGLTVLVVGAGLAAAFWYGLPQLRNRLARLAKPGSLW